MRIVVICAPCHLPNIDSTTNVPLCKRDNLFGCEVCHFVDQRETKLLFDARGTGWHMACLGNPPLIAIPKGEWIYPHCVHDCVTLHDVAEERKKQRTAELANPSPVSGDTSTFKDAAMHWQCSAAQKPHSTQGSSSASWLLVGVPWRALEVAALSGRGIAVKRKQGELECLTGQASLLGLFSGVEGV